LAPQKFGGNKKKEKKKRKKKQAIFAFRRFAKAMRGLNPSAIRIDNRILI